MSYLIVLWLGDLLCKPLCGAVFGASHSSRGLDLKGPGGFSMIREVVDVNNHIQHQTMP